MTLLSQLTEDRKQAMRDKHDIKKNILNFVLAQIKNKKIELQKDLEDSEIIQIIKKEVKAINETLSFLEKTDKKEETLEEQQKKLLLEYYLPQTLSREQTETIIKKLIGDLEINDIKTQRGLLMKEIMAKHKGEIDGGLVNDIINNL